MTTVQRRLAITAAAFLLAIGCAIALSMPQQNAYAANTRLTPGNVITKATNLPLVGRELWTTNFATFNATNDSNFYKFQTSNRDSRYKITLRSDDLGENEKLRVVIYDPSYHRFKVEDSTTTQISFYLEKLKRNQSYYIEVYRYAVDAPEGNYMTDVPYVDYRIKVQEVITKPAALVFSEWSFKWYRKSKRLVYYIKEPSFSATGYQIRCFNPITRKWKYATTTKNSYIVKGITTYKKYKANIRPYRIVNGRTYYGKWSQYKYRFVDYKQKKSKNKTVKRIG